MSKYAGTILLILLLLGLIVAISRLADNFHKEVKAKELKIQNLEQIKLEQETNYKDLESKYKKLKVSKVKSTPLTKTATIPQFPVTQAANLSSGKCEKYRSEAAKYSWNVEIALAVMFAESGCNPNAVSPTNDHGLMQLHAIPIYDPVKNIAYAYTEKYLKGGWSHWSVCNNYIVKCW